MTKAVAVFCLSLTKEAVTHLSNVVQLEEEIYTSGCFSAVLQTLHAIHGAVDNII